MKKSVFWVVVIALILIALGLGFSTFKGCTKNKAVVSKNDTLGNELSAANSEISSLYDSISTLNTALDDCPKYKAKKRSAQSQPRRTSSTPAATNPARQIQRTTKPEVVVPADNPSRTENTGLSGDQYVGIFNGSHGVTINEESQLVYFISNEELNAGEGKMTLAAPQLNGKNSGKEFYWDASKKLWIYESNTIITIARLLGGQPIVWCVYLGDHQQWGYPMFTPHEIVKTGSSSVRSAMAKGEVVQHTQDEGCDYHSLIQFKKK